MSAIRVQPTSSGSKLLGLPYRLGVGIMLLSADGRIWLGRRQPKWIADKSRHIWQMPQGGIEPKETPIEAALRELREETGVTSVELIADFPGWLSYDLPAELIGVALKGRYRGQRQRWFCMRFLGEEGEISTRPLGYKPEFDSWKWASGEEVLALAPVFKRRSYEALVRSFRTWIA